MPLHLRPCLQTEPSHGNFQLERRTGRVRSTMSVDNLMRCGVFACIRCPSSSSSPPSSSSSLQAVRTVTSCFSCSHHSSVHIHPIWTQSRRRSCFNRGSFYASETASSSLRALFPPCIRTKIHASFTLSLLTVATLVRRLRPRLSGLLQHFNSSKVGASTIRIAPSTSFLHLFAIPSTQQGPPPRGTFHGSHS